MITTAMNCYLVQLLESGFLHADPHPGNLLKTPDGRLCVLDFGLMTTVAFWTIISPFHELALHANKFGDFYPFESKLWAKSIANSVFFAGYWRSEVHIDWIHIPPDELRLSSCSRWFGKAWFCSWRQSWPCKNSSCGSSTHSRNEPTFTRWWYSEDKCPAGSKLIQSASILDWMWLNKTHWSNFLLALELGKLSEGLKKL